MNKRMQKELARTGKPVYRLHFLGSAGGVTGSLMLVEMFSREGAKRFLLDVGLHVDQQSLDFQNRLPKGMTGKDIDFVVISHAHLDHSGYLPKLIKEGFTGPAYCTPATFDLMEILLPDSGFLQEEAVKRFNNRLTRRAEAGNQSASQNTAVSKGGKVRGGADGGKQKGKRGVKAVAVNASASAVADAPRLRQPLYTEEEARASLKCVKTIDYNVRTKLAEDIFVTFTDAGHILGSAVVTMDLGSGANKRSLCFTGNIGRDNPPVLQTLAQIKGADYVITESTYGNRVHKVRDRHARLAEIINKGYERAKQGKKDGAGVILIPAFAVGRAQIVLDDLRQLMDKKMIPNLKTYLDGRMSIKATDVHRKHANLLNAETQAVINAGGDPFATPRFELCREWTDSARLQEPQSEPIIVVGSSGMANGGRIVSHLSKRLSGPENTVVFVGYQGTGTLGNALVRFADGNPFSERNSTAHKANSDATPKTANVAGKSIKVRATVEFMSDYSGHADGVDICRWLGKFKQTPKNTFVVHGDDDALAGMRDQIVSRLHWDVTIPKAREVFELS
ncbi:MBL fold metallo-hydrolase [Candidatus Obscuribacterales bacterium]|nr:MBL fold metallo-hydrolase [Candidatus Obscuribacterales bacterium]